MTTHLHQTLLARLHSPNLDLVLLGAGALLLLLECNLPGAILPGALGLLLVLAAVYGLSLQSLQILAVLLLLVAVAALALSSLRPLFGIPALLGTAALVVGLLSLTPGVSPFLALCVGLTLGLACALLGRVAWQARRNKALLALPSAPKSRLNT